MDFLKQQLYPPLTPSSLARELQCALRAYSRLPLRVTSIAFTLSSDKKKVCWCHKQSGVAASLRRECARRSYHDFFSPPFSFQNEQKCTCLFKRLECGCMPMRVYTHNAPIADPIWTAYSKKNLFLSFIFFIIFSRSRPFFLPPSPFLLFPIPLPIQTAVECCDVGSLQTSCRTTRTSPGK